MTWTDQARKHFFCNDDEHFKEHYYLHPDTTLPQPGLFSVKALRGVLNEIARLVPSAAHVWRPWDPCPLVVIGRLDESKSGREIVQETDAPRIGVCWFAGELRLFADEEFVKCYDAKWLENWEKWDSDKICLPRSFAESCWASQGKLHCFLEEIEKKLKTSKKKNIRFTPGDRKDLEEPNGLKCIYPKLEGSVPYIQAKFYGIVYETDGSPNLFESLVACSEQFDRKCNTAVGGRLERVLFLCCGPDEACIEEILAQILSVKSDLQENILPPPCPPEKCHGVKTYCYAYFNPAKPLNCEGTWDNAFYVGVGTIGENDGPWGGRWTSHVDDALNKGTLPRHEIIRKWFEKNPKKNCSEDDRSYAAGRGLVRKLYHFSGEYRDQLKFATEIFLIFHAFGAHGLENATKGNLTSAGYFCVPRPYVFNKCVPQHVWCWRELVSACIKSPSDKKIRNTRIPATVSLFVAQFAGELDNQLKRLQLHPLCVQSGGRLDSREKMFMHIDVSGASDVVLSYWALHGHYRIDLVFAMAESRFAINMRPISGRKSAVKEIKDSFIKYIKCKTEGSYTDEFKPVKNIKNDPYYKPMAYNANGKAGDWFPIGWTPGLELTFPRATITMPNWHADPGNLQDLNLLDALSLILKRFD